MPISKHREIAQLGPYGDVVRRANRRSWLSRLEVEHISEVLTFTPRSIEQRYMDGMPQRFQRLAGDHEWGLHRIRP